MHNFEENFVERDDSNVKKTIQTRNIANHKYKG